LLDREGVSCIIVVLEKITVTKVLWTCGKGILMLYRKDPLTLKLKMKKYCCLGRLIEKVLGVQVPLK